MNLLATWMLLNMVEISKAKGGSVHVEFSCHLKAVPAPAAEVDRRAFTSEKEGRPG